MQSLFQIRDFPVKMTLRLLISGDKAQIMPFAPKCKKKVSFFQGFPYEGKRRASVYASKVLPDISLCLRNALSWGTHGWILGHEENITCGDWVVRVGLRR